MIALLVAAMAVAQDDTWFEGIFYPDLFCPFDRVGAAASDQIIDEALATNAALYGATDLVEHVVLPGLAEHVAQDDDPNAMLFAFRLDGMLGVEHIPAANCSSDTGLVNAPVDLMANRMAFGFRKDWIGGFYAVSVNGYGVHNQQITRLTAPYLLLGLNAAYGYAAPFIPAGTTEGRQFTLVWDWIGGITLSPGTFEATVGYVGSTGVYTNFDERKTRLFLRGVLQRAPVAGARMALPYAALGFDQLPMSERVVEAAGRTRLFGRKLRWYTLPGDAPSGASESTDGSFDLYSVHVEQLGMVKGLFDLKLTAATKPAPLLHELSVGVHSRGFDPERVTAPGAGVWLGAVTLPPARHYDVAPGAKPMLVVDAGGPVPNGGSVRLGLRLNDPRTLDVHPYGVGSAVFFFEASPILPE